VIVTGPAAARAAAMSAPQPQPQPPSAAADDGGVLMLAKLKQLTSVVAPTTLVTSLLFYFGYIGTRSRFAYFGVYLDMTDLSNQQLLLYGLEVIYIPAALGFLAVLVAITCHACVVWLLDVRKNETVILIIGLGAVLAGILLIGRALVGIFVVGVYDSEAPGTTGLAIAFGPAMTAYGCWIGARRARRTAADATGRTGLLGWYDGPSSAGLRRAGQICVGGLVIAGLFLAVHNFAWTSGSARAYKDAVKLPTKPEVVLDTREQLVDLPAGVIESMLPVTKQATFRYRYRGLRLLLSSGGRLFLVPTHWTKHGSTMVVPYDGDVRIRLIPTPGGEQS
jgi:hypothetical protein